MRVKEKIRSVFATAAIISGVASAFGCSELTPKKVPQKVGETEIVRNEGGNKVAFNRAIDILFVVDDSGSMEDHQANLAQNVKKFTSGIMANQILDYHIGVVTSNMERPPLSSRPGQAWKGELWGTTKYVSRSTPSGTSVLEANLQPGTDGSGTEMFFTPVQTALTAPLVMGANSGFYRPDAYLAIIFLTDSDDQSELSAKDFYKFLLGLKNNDPSKIIVYGVNIPSTDRSCGRSTEPMPLKLEEFYKLANVTAAQNLGLCDPNFGMKLAELGADLVRRVGRVLYLSRLAAESTIVVTYGSQIIARDPNIGWVYDATRNALIFGQDMNLAPEPPNTKIEVYFETAEAAN